MRGGVLPPAMLCLALGLVLAFVPLRIAIRCVVLAAAAAIAVWLMPRVVPIEVVFAGCWASVIVVAAMTYLPRPPRAAFACALAVDAGAWAGATAGAAGGGRDLAFALPLLLVFVVGRQFVARGWSIPLKVGASWLIAIATLAAMLPLIPTPGYVPDHMD